MFSASWVAYQRCSSVIRAWGLLIFGLCVGWGASAAHASPDRSWTGANSALWSDPNNWSPVGVPTDGETLLFPSVAAAQRVSTNDVPGLTLSSLLFTGAGYTLNGSQGIVLTANLSLAPGDDETISLPIDVQGYAVTLNLGQPPSSTSLSLTGALSGSGPITVQGNYLTLSGSLDSYSGTIIVNGYLTTDTTSSSALTFVNNDAIELQGASLPNASVQSSGVSIFFGGYGTLGGSVTTKSLWPPTGPLHTGDMTISGGSASFGHVGGPNASLLGVTGIVTLGANTTLAVSIDSSWVPIVGEEVMLIDNDGNEPVSGTFANMPEGTIITLNFVPFRLSYQGGDGNDVVLVAYPSMSATSTSIDSVTPAQPIVGEPADVGYSVSGGQSPSGVVTVSASTSESCSDTVAIGHCTLVFPSTGPRILTASYSGDVNNAGSTSPATVLTIGAAATALSLTSATPDPSMTGNPVVVSIALTAVAPAGGQPSGNVVISAEDSAGCVIALPASSCSMIFAQSGTKTIGAQYTGDANYASSIASPLSHSVTDPPHIDLTIAVDDGIAFAAGGQPLTYLITVQNIGSADAHNATVAGALPANLSNANWTCAPVGNASCTPSGTGGVLDTVQLPASTAIVYELTVNLAALPEQDAVYAASVTAAVGETDSNPNNNSGSDTDRVGIFADGFDNP
jgi:uncharacterized repeat protein (TIGR01451 family)